MEERAREVLFRTRRHATGTYAAYPPTLQQPNQGSGRSLLSFLSPRVIVQLKERWTEDKNPRKSRRSVSLFVSPTAEHVAIAFRSQITFLHEDNDYQVPTATFNSGTNKMFICGTWSEAHDVLGVVDDSDDIYFLKANGEEITRITKKHLKLSLPILGLILQDENDAKKSCLCTFSILTSDGLLHDVEIGQDPSACLFSAKVLHNGALLKKQVFCLDYCPTFSLFATVSAAGCAPFPKTSECPGLVCLSLWRRTTCSVLELITSAEFEGLYSNAKDHKGWLTHPKVLTSPSGKFIATLDVRGCLFIFMFHEEQCSLLCFSAEKIQNSKIETGTSSEEREFLTDIVDFAWWSDDFLAVVKRDGTFAVFDAHTGLKLSQNDGVYTMPLLARASKTAGYLFLLESKPVSQEYESYDKGESNLYLDEQFDATKVLWNLVSFSEISVSEMYDMLICNEEYQSALRFADRHGLDKDEVLKSQWLSSGKGVHEINTLLSAIKDQAFVLSECNNSIGPTEDAMKVLLAFGLRLTEHYKFFVSEDDEGIQALDFCIARLKLLQFRDRLETFLGINMGRFSVQDYNKFRSSPINEAAVVLAEKGKIGALNLLFKRHPYSLVPFMLDVLAAIPETVPVQNYAQLLPGNSPPVGTVLREEDWVECDKMILLIEQLPNDYSSSNQIRTEPIVKKCTGFQWPSTSDLAMWYKSRAREIDSLCGQLDNSMCLIDMACRKGISELEQFLEDITYLDHLIYCDDHGDSISLSLNVWEQLSDYEKFKLMLMGVKEENVIERLQKMALPFMKKKSSLVTSQSEDSSLGSKSTADKIVDSFLVRWLKEISLENKIEICSIVIGVGFGSENNRFFADDTEVVDSALQCIYLCSATDKWTTMASILSKLPPLRGSEYEELKSRLRLAEGHIEAGRLLSIFQVPKPINFFLESHLDEKGVKQILRLILSKFIRRQLGRSDNDWANLWHDLLSLQEKAFPFLDLEYVLIEFCRGLLKAGKFSLARNYLKGTGSVALAADKAENLVIQAAREYFFSASSLDSQEIWKAKECLNILPGNRNVRAEIDIINAVTVKLPNLGVSILPVQFRQMKDPMEIIKIAITSQAGAYLNVDELIEVAKLLGLNSQDEISAVQEAIAREAAVAGDLQLAFDLCFLLAKKGHGSVWDLCAALARGPALENMDISSRKHLLGFSLSHCDEESIGELLHAWKDLDMQGQCESLMTLTGQEPHMVHGSSNVSNPSYATLGTADVEVWSEKDDNVGFDDQEVQFNKIKEVLSLIANNLYIEETNNWESLRDNGKILSFAALDLPWLLQLSTGEETGGKHISSSISLKKYVSTRAQAIFSILSWLAMNNLAPKDDLIASLAKTIMEPPVTEEEDILGCSFLLNLVDAFNGVDVIEGFVKMRDKYNEINSIMNVGMIYGRLHNCGVECLDPGQRRMLLTKEFENKQRSVTSGEMDQLDKTQSTFWREWKMKLEEQKRVADQSRILQQIIPGVDTARCLSGDMEYIETVVFSLIESLKLEKKHILKDLSKLVQTYGLDKTKVFLHYISSIFVSNYWTVEDIVVDISELKEELVASAPETIEVITSSIYPMIDGHDKQRLACIYSLLSDCYLQLEEQKEAQPIINPDLHHSNIERLAHFNQIVGQECYRISFIGGLDFKNVAGLQDLNWNHFSSEICSHIDESSVEALANMVHNLLGIYGDSVPVGNLSWQDAYKHYLFRLMKVLETESKTLNDFQSSQNLYAFVHKLEQTYDVCRKYVKFLESPHVLDLMKLFFTVILTIEKPLRCKSFDSSTWQECLIMLLNLWLRLVYEFRELELCQNSDEIFSECLAICLKDFVNLIIESKVSPYEGWGTVVGFVNFGLDGGIMHEVFNFCRAMLFSGCRFVFIAEVFMDAIGRLPPGSAMVLNANKISINIQDLPHLYLGILETILPDLEIGSLQQQNLHCLLSSLSKLEGDLEELKRVRHVVWERIAEFSGNLELPSHIRVYIMELMQFISATRTKGRGFSAEIEASLLPWEGCEDIQNTTVNHEKTTADQVTNITDTSNRFKNTLVALKSSQLLSIISPSMEITAEDLLTVKSAVSCFLEVSNSATSEAHLDALVAVLGEWDGLFVNVNTDSPKLSDDGNDWSNDDWDEGWESFQDEPREEKVKDNTICSIHPLHVCWLEIFKKMFMLSRYMELPKLIDQYSGQMVQILLDEDDAKCLSQIAVNINSILALKLTMLFPFEAPQVQCLGAVEDMLKQRGIPEELGHDHEFLVLVLSSGIISKIINRSSYSTLFSCLCYLIGNLSRQCQEAQLSSHRSMIVNEDDQHNKKLSILFTGLLLPCYISELVKADQLILAGFIVTKFLHTNASFSLVNVTDAILRRYLQNQLRMLQGGESFVEGLTYECEFSNSIVSLRGKIANLVQSAVSLLSSSGR